MITKLKIVKITSNYLKHLNIVMGTGDTNFNVYDSSFTDLSTVLQWNVNDFVTYTLNNTLSRFVLKYTEDLTFFVTDGTGENEVDFKTFLNVAGGLAVSIKTSGSLSGASDTNLPLDETYDGYYIKYDHTSGLFVYGSPTAGQGISNIVEADDVTFSKVEGNDGKLLRFNFTSGKFEAYSMGSDEVFLIDGAIESLSGEATTQAEMNAEIVEHLKQDHIKTKEYTGFFENENVVVTYNSTLRTITLTGTVDAYWRGSKLNILTSGWESTAHPDTGDSYFLYFNGTDFVWTLTPWTFDMLQIAYVGYNQDGEFIGALREVHGLTEDYESHKEFHNQVGTYCSVYGEITGVVDESTTASERRPLIGATTINDEDIETVNSALLTNSYTIGYFNTSGVFKVSQSNTDIIKLSGNIPYYNHYDVDTDEYTDTLLTDGEFFCVYLVSVPSTADAYSQANRYVFLQGQKTYTTIEGAKLEKINSLYLSEITNVFSELVSTHKFVIRYKDLNWYICCHNNINGSKMTQLANENTEIKSGALAISNPLTESIIANAETQNVVNEQNANAINILFDTINQLAGATSTIYVDPTPFAVTTTPTELTYNITKNSTNTDIFSLDEPNNKIDIHKAGSYQWIYNLDIDNSLNQTYDITFQTRSVAENVTTIGVANDIVVSNYMKYTVDQRVYISGTTLPVGLTAGYYYVKSKGDNYITLSATLGGAVITLASGTYNFNIEIILSTSGAIPISKDGLTASYTTQVEIPIDEVSIKAFVFASVVSGLSINSAVGNFILNSTSATIGTTTSSVDVVDSELESISGTATTQAEVNAEVVAQIDTNASDILELQNRTYYKEKHITIDGASAGDELFWFVTTADTIVFRDFYYITDSGDTVTFTVEDDASTPNVYLSSVTAGTTVAISNVNTTINPADNLERTFKVIANTTFSGQLHVTLRYTDNIFYQV